jgi:ABC-type phosphate transport system substrate-binding protein
VGILMSTPLFSRRELIALTTSALFLSASGVALAGSDAIAVVVGVKNAQRSLSLDDLRRIFFNKDTNDADGDRFVPLNQRSGNTERARFDAQVLNMTPDQVARYWIDQRLRGKRAPATVPSLAMLKRALNELPGAISYVAVAELDTSIRALTIDGRAPNDGSYPIR